MATFRTYAEVLRSDHVQVRAYEAELRCGPPGLVLADILRCSGGVYETTVSLTPRMRADLREVAELTSDEHLRQIPELSDVPVPLGHLRGLDPQTRIVVGVRLDLDGDEGPRPERSRRTPPDPGTATLIGDYVAPGGSQDASRMTVPGRPAR